MARRVIRRRRPSGSRVIRRAARPAAAEAVRAAPQPVEPTGTPILMATTNTMRNQIVPKLSVMDDIVLSGLADSPETAIKMLVQEHPEVVILDMDFGGPLIGLDTAKLMQKTRIRAAIVMLVSELDPEEMKSNARLFGSSWSYVKKTTAGKVDVLQMVLKSASRGVQWIEPSLTRVLAAIWKVADEARDLEAARSAAEPATITSPTKLKNARFETPVASGTPAASAEEEVDLDTEDLDEIAPGIKTKSTSEAETDGLNIAKVSVGHGGRGQNVGKVRRTG
jgi:DNA-binding NarL/FixJ family response regulator